jgi:hypothetical protein
MFAVGPLYYLFYGAAAWYSASAGIGYALCTSALGPCVDMSRSGAWMASHGEAVGPSGPAIFTDSTGSTSIAYHAWTGAVGYEYGGVRSLWIDRLSLIGIPIVS